LDQLVLVDVSRRHIGDFAAVAENNDAICNLEHVRRMWLMMTTDVPYSRTRFASYGALEEAVNGRITAREPLRVDPTRTGACP
jgi:hypothetical protein